MKKITLLAWLLAASLAFQTELFAKGKNDKDKDGSEEELVPGQGQGGGGKGKGQGGGGGQGGGNKQKSNGGGGGGGKGQGQGGGGGQGGGNKQKANNDQGGGGGKGQGQGGGGGGQGGGNKNKANDDGNKGQGGGNKNKANDDNNKGQGGGNKNKANDDENKGQGGGNKNKDDDNKGQGGGNKNKDDGNNKGQGGGNKNKDDDNKGQGGGNKNKDDDNKGQGGGSKNKDDDNNKGQGNNNRDDKRDGQGNNNKGGGNKNNNNNNTVKVDDRDKRIEKQKNIDRSTNVNIDRRPGKAARPERKERKREYVEVQQRNVKRWESWRSEKVVHVERFQVERYNRWNNITVNYSTRGWPRRYHDPEYRVWRRNVWDFRRARAEEIWVYRRDRWDDIFDDHWWGYAAWRPRPRVYVNVNPWWWRRPVVWNRVTVFFGGSIAPRPIVYDPGTTVIYQDNDYYVDGELRGNARTARRAAIALAHPQVEETPIPEPAESGEEETWEPLGVWALTQEDEGDATMFMQLSVNRDGVVAGAYKNVMTGDEQPIVGQLDKEKQVLAWHIGEASDTVYETGLSNLENDVASVFVHFGEDETQTWLLVRLPDPEIPPGAVKVPDYVAQN